MSNRKFWSIRITNDYFDQVSQLPIEIQVNIERFIRELSTTQNPRTVGESYNCPRDDYILAIFPGLEYEFILKIDEQNHIIRLISCERLGFLDHGQTETI